MKAIRPSASGRVRALLAVALVASTLAHGRALAQPVRVGSGPDALPAVYEVPLAVPTPLGVGARVGLGYGRTEGVLGVGDSHHRAQLDAAASLTALPWLAASIRLLGRYDSHVGGSDDGDYGIISETHLSGRAEYELDPAFRVGTRLALWFPGAKSVADAPGGLSGDLQLLGSYVPDASPLTLGVVFGLRVDRSSHAGGDPYLYSASDRLALGASASALAAHMGLGLSYRVGSVDLLAEWSWRMYFDYAGTSPMWLRAGARYRASRSLQLEALFGFSPSKRPKLDAAAPLEVVEPRVSAGIAAALAFPWEVSSENEAEPVPPEPERPTTANVGGRVVSAAGASIEGALLRFTREQSTQEVVSHVGGEFSAHGLQPGTYQLSVTASGWVAHEETLTLGRGDDRQLQVTLARELPKGQIRGTVRKFNGQPLAATIAIAALGVKAQNGADGSFEVNVPPGEYEVLVKARGFKAQTRRARVEEDGVAILIVELEPTSKK